MSLNFSGFGGGGDGSIGFSVWLGETEQFVFFPTFNLMTFEKWRE